MEILKKLVDEIKNADMDIEHAKTIIKVFDEKTDDEINLLFNTLKKYHFNEYAYNIF